MGIMNIGHTPSCLRALQIVYLGHLKANVKSIAERPVHEVHSLSVCLHADIICALAWTGHHEVRTVRSRQTSVRLASPCGMTRPHHISEITYDQHITRWFPKRNLQRSTRVSLRVTVLWTWVAPRSPRSAQISYS